MPTSITLYIDRDLLAEVERCASHGERSEWIREAIRQRLEREANLQRAAEEALEDEDE